MSAHTPGPWVAVPQSDGSAMVAHECATGKQLNPKGLRLVAHVMARGKSLLEDEANARLIAAAPELLAVACKALDAWTGDGPPIDLDELRAAIAKAGAA